MKIFFKISAWTLLGVVLFVIATCVAATRLLTPEKLTPLVVTLANKHLNADVRLGRVALDLRGAYPFVELRIDSLCIISRDIKALPPHMRDSLPAWADTLVQAKSIKGGLHLPRLAAGVVLLSDLEIYGPAANIIIVNDTLNNFTITLPSAQTADDSEEVKDLPDVRIRGFRIFYAGLMRFSDMQKDMALSGRLTSASLQSLSDPEDAPPSYNINLYADFDSPVFRHFNAGAMRMGFDGDIDWNPSKPFRVRLSDFTVAADSVSARFSAAMDFSDSIVIESFEGRIGPLSLSYALSRLPVGARMPKGVRTDASISADVCLAKPYTVGGSEALPYADILVDLPDCYLKWQRVDLRKLALTLRASIRGDDLDKAVLCIDRCVFAGPATWIELSGEISNPASDPLFDGRIDGHTSLQRLPQPLAHALIGAGRMTGRIDMHTEIKARPSMLTRNGFHRLRINGAVHLSDFMYMDADSLTSVEISNLWAKLGTNSSVTGRGADGSASRIDSLLTASIETDSLIARIPGVDAKIGGFKMAMGAENRNIASDTASIIPFGGFLQCRVADLVMPNDSVRLRLRDVDGSLRLRRYHNDRLRPQLNLKTSIGRIAAVTKALRFMAQDNRLETEIHLLDNSLTVRERKRIKALSDSISRLYPHLTPDSVMSLAIARREELRRQRRARPTAGVDSISSTEAIDWGIGAEARRFLLDWDFSGNLVSARAVLFTPAFPLRNTMEHLDLRFSNDSIILSDVAYKAGHSDFTVSGSVANMKRAFASRRPQPLKVSMDLWSDTLDVNQLSAAFFSGAAARQHIFDSDLETDTIGFADAVSDTVGPLLIPANIDAAFRMRARNILYSDFMLHDLRGAAMMRDGALNLRRLKAVSDIGSIDLSALYAAPNRDDMRFAFGLDLERFRIGDFLRLMPAIDSIMPMIGDFDGVINATIAATTDITPQMDIDLPTLEAAVKIEGDSLVLLDPETFKTMSKWLMFKDKKHNLIRRMEVELTVRDNNLTLYPFMFDIDRYRLGVQGHNDLAMNFDYHVSVLKSPLPFKFGINIKGNADDYKIRVGKARFNEKQAAEQRSIADTTRINLINQVEDIFRRGVQTSRRPKIQVSDRPRIDKVDDDASDTISAADSLMLKQQGIDL